MSEHVTLIVVSTCVGFFMWILISFTLCIHLTSAQGEENEPNWAFVMMFVVVFLIVGAVVLHLNLNMCIQNKLYFTAPYTAEVECELYELMESSSVVRSQPLKVYGSEREGVHEFHLSTKIREKDKLMEIVEETVSFPVFDSFEEAVIDHCHRELN